MRRLDRLEKVVRERSLGQPQLIGLRDQAGQGQNGDFCATRQSAELQNKIEPVDVRQRQVLQDEIGFFVSHQFEGVLAVRRLQDGVALGLQSNAHHLP